MQNRWRGSVLQRQPSCRSLLVQARLRGALVTIGSFHAPPDASGAEAEYETTWSDMSAGLKGFASKFTLLGGDANVEFPPSAASCPGVGPTQHGGSASDRADSLGNFLAHTHLRAASTHFWHC